MTSRRLGLADERRDRHVEDTCEHGEVIDSDSVATALPSRHRAGREVQSLGEIDLSHSSGFTCKRDSLTDRRMQSLGFHPDDYSDKPSVLSRGFSANPSVCNGAIVVVAKKEYLPYPVTKQWCEDVKTELAKGKRGMQERLREYIESRGIECSSGHLADILKGKYDTSDIVGPVHEFLKWPDPLPPTASRDAGELAYLLKRLTPEQREGLANGMIQIGELSGEEARDLLAQLFPKKKT